MTKGPPFPDQATSTETSTTIASTRVPATPHPNNPKRQDKTPHQVSKVGAGQTCGASSAGESARHELTRRRTGERGGRAEAPGGPPSVTQVGAGHRPRYLARCSSFGKRRGPGGFRFVGSVAGGPWATFAGPRPQVAGAPPSCPDSLPETSFMRLETPLVMFLICCVCAFYALTRRMFDACMMQS